MMSRRGIEYDLIQALRRNPTIIQAGDDICGAAADEIERLRALINRAGALAMQNVSAEHIRSVLAEDDR